MLLKTSAFLSLVALVSTSAFAQTRTAAPSAAAPPAPAAAAPATAAKQVPGYPTDMINSDCRDPDYIAATVPFDNITRQAFAFRPPVLTSDRQDYATKFTGGDLAAADKELALYTNYYTNEFYKVVQPGEMKLNEILGRGEITTSPYKTATNFAHAWEHLVTDNLGSIFEGSKALENRRRLTALDRQESAEAYGLKAAYAKLVGQMKTNNYAEVWKQHLFRFCGKFSANASFGDTKVRVVGCGSFHPQASWQHNQSDGKEDMNLCHIPVQCLATYAMPKPGEASVPQELPDTHYFSVSCPRNLCSDMKACVEADGAAGSTPLNRLSPGKQVQ